MKILSFKKLKAYVMEFPNEFMITPEDNLYCSTCGIIVNHDRRSSIAKHRSPINIVRDYI